MDGFWVPVALSRVRCDPHLVVVAAFHHDHGDGAAVIFALWGVLRVPSPPLVDIAPRCP